MLRPVKNRRYTDHIVEQLKEFILDKNLNPGEKLPHESVLAETFGVSRGTIREALHMLEHDGIVQIKKGPGGGIFISEGNLFQVIDSILYALRWEKISLNSLLEARKILEDRIARLAALRATDSDHEVIEAILNQMESAETSHAQFISLDTDFHVALAKVAKNEILHVFMVAVKELHNRLLDKTDIPDDLYPTAIGFHRKIFEAVKAGDPQQAAALMAEHLDYFGGHFQDLNMADIQGQHNDRSKL